MKNYNGHRSWNAWNVSLWINNDEAMYNAARATVDEFRNRMPEATNNKVYLKAARELYQNGLWNEKTPDGANYNILCVKLALEGM